MKKMLRSEKQGTWEKRWKETFMPLAGTLIFIVIAATCLYYVLHPYAPKPKRDAGECGK